MRSPRSKAAGCTSEAFFPSVSATYALAQPGGALRGLRSLALVRPTSTPEGERAPSQRCGIRVRSPFAEAALRVAGSGPDGGLRAGETATEGSRGLRRS